MILRGKLKDTESSTQLRGGNKFVRCEYVKGGIGQISLLCFTQYEVW